MIQMWHRLAQDARLIMLLIISNIMLFGLLILMGISFYNMPDQIRVIVPPSLNSTAVLKIDETPDEFAAEFAFSIWQLINNWPENGDEDAERLLMQYQAYLSQPFQNEQKKALARMRKKGEVQNRVRQVLPVEGGFPTKHTIKRVSKDTWHVELHSRLVEHLNGHVIKDRIMCYPIVIKQNKGNFQHNPFGLVLEGLYDSVSQVSTKEGLK